MLCSRDGLPDRADRGRFRRTFLNRVFISRGQNNNRIVCPPFLCTRRVDSRGHSSDAHSQTDHSSVGGDFVDFQCPVLLCVA